MSPANVDWQGLAQIKELKAYFEEDCRGFQQLIEQAFNQMTQFNQEDLEHLTELRVLEVTNGCVQWGFRLKDEHRLSVEETRECMRRVIGFIKEKKMYFPSKGNITFRPELEAFIQEGRELYWDAFKHHLPGAERQYYASSTGQFIAYGRQRLEAAMELVKQDYETFFSPYFIQRGQNYIAPYLACI